MKSKQKYLKFDLYLVISSVHNILYLKIYYVRHASVTYFFLYLQLRIYKRIPYANTKTNTKDNTRYELTASYYHFFFIK